MEFLGRIQQFFRDVMAEFRRVTWPSRDDVVNSTIVVLFVVFVLAAFLWMVDISLAWVVGRIVG
jgi:preprotein translocase subunit SecE